MKKESEKLIDEALSLKTREESLAFDENKVELITALAKNGNEMARQALIYLCVLATPEDYDNDIYD